MTDFFIKLWHDDPLLLILGCVIYILLVIAGVVAVRADDVNIS